MEDFERYGVAIRAFNKQVNAAIVDPGFIAGVRKTLSLDQREAAEIFGVGVSRKQLKIIEIFIKWHVDELTSVCDDHGIFPGIIAR